jgi:hypothetical protein
MDSKSLFRTLSSYQLIHLDNKSAYASIYQQLQNRKWMLDIQSLAILIDLMRHIPLTKIFLVKLSQEINPTILKQLEIGQVADLLIGFANLNSFEIAEHQILDALLEESMKLLIQHNWFLECESKYIPSILHCLKLITTKNPIFASFLNQISKAIIDRDLNYTLEQYISILNCCSKIGFDSHLFFTVISMIKKRGLLDNNVINDNLVDLVLCFKDYNNSNLINSRVGFVDENLADLVLCFKDYNNSNLINSHVDFVYILDKVVDTLIQNGMESYNPNQLYTLLVSFYKISNNSTLKHVEIYKMFADVIINQNIEYNADQSLNLINIYYKLDNDKLRDENIKIYNFKKVRDCIFNWMIKNNTNFNHMQLLMLIESATQSPSKIIMKQLDKQSNLFNIVQMSKVLDYFNKFCISKGKFISKYFKKFNRLTEIEIDQFHPDDISQIVYTVSREKHTKSQKILKRFYPTIIKRLNEFSHCNAGRLINAYYNIGSLNVKLKSKFINHIDLDQLLICLHCYEKSEILNVMKNFKLNSKLPSDYVKILIIKCSILGEDVGSITCAINNLIEHDMFSKIRPVLIVQLMKSLENIQSITPELLSYTSTSIFDRIPFDFDKFQILQLIDVCKDEMFVKCLKRYIRTDSK